MSDIKATTQTIDILQSAIKAEYLRQKTIASNIANLETPGYRRVDVKFEQLLAQALKSNKPISPENIEPEIYQPNDTPVKPNGNNVTLEKEVGNLVENSLRYKTYVRLLNKKFQQITQATQTP